MPSSNLNQIVEQDDIFFIEFYCKFFLYYLVINLKRDKVVINYLYWNYQFPSVNPLIINQTDFFN